MEFGTVEDHAGVAVVGHLLEREGRADPVTGQLLAALGVAGPDPDRVVDREAGMWPLAHALGELGVEAGFRAEKVQNLLMQGFDERLFRDRRQDAEAAGGVEHAIGDQGMDVRVEGDHVAEGLDVEDEAGPAFRGHCLEAFAEQVGDDLAKPGEQGPVFEGSLSSKS